MTCPFASIEDGGDGECIGYRKNQYTCTNSNADLEYCGTYRYKTGEK